MALGENMAVAVSHVEGESKQGDDCVMTQNQLLVERTAQSWDPTQKVLNVTLTNALVGDDLQKSISLLDVFLC